MSLCNNYEYIIDSSHPKAFQNGLVYKHIVVAESVLGRYLKKDESVHHIDKNKTNNAPNNLMVFHTDKDHISFHSNNCDLSTIKQLNDGSWISLTLQTRCPVCGNTKSPNSKTCLKCKQSINNYSNIPSTKPSKKELLNVLLKEKGNFTKIGRIYSVSDNAVRKWCKSYNLSPYSKDYKIN